MDWFDRYAVYESNLCYVSIKLVIEDEWVKDGSLSIPKSQNYYNRGFYCGFILIFLAISKPSKLMWKFKCGADYYDWELKIWENQFKTSTWFLKSNLWSLTN